MKAILASHWVRHPRVWYVIGGLFWVAIVVMVFLGRDTPTHFAPQLYTPNAHPGDVVQLMVPVKRNLGRGCGVDSTRTFFDSNHASDRPEGPTHISAEGLVLREKANPGMLIFNVAVPKSAAYGMATVITEVQYSCPFNPTTWLSKIDDAFAVYINVTPKLPQP